MAATCLILAAGGSERFGGKNKLLAEIRGRCTVLEAAVTNAWESSIADYFVIVANDETERAAKSVLETLGIPGEVVRGGERRGDSVREGLNVSRGDFVLVHDAARPLASPALFKRVRESLDEYSGAVPVVPAHDSLLLMIREGVGPRYISRDRLTLVQTPQGFPLDALRYAYSRADDEGLSFTDDGSLFVHFGGRIRTVEGERLNLKVTLENDLEIIRSLQGAMPNIGGVG